MQQKNINKEISKLEPQLGQKPTDVLRGLVKATLNTVPYVGGAIASLVEDFIPGSRLDRLIRFTQDLANDLKEVAERIDKNYIKTEEFAYLFEKTYRAVMENYQKEKLECYRAILVNSLVNQEFSAEKKELYFRFISNLTVLHIKLLKVLRNPTKFMKDAEITVRPVEGYVTISGALCQFFPGLEESTIETLLRDLDSMGLTKGISEALKIEMSGMNVSINGIDGKLSVFGNHLIQFITMPEDI